MLSTLEQNILEIKGKIKAAAIRAKRNPEDIHLVAVTKNIPPDKIQKAFELGIKTFGENRVQEARIKASKITAKPAWHLIGHLQRNKAKHAVELFSLIHSVDSLRLAKEIDKRARNLNKVMDILIQVNIGREKTKFGINPRYVESFLQQISEFPNLKIKGLMAIAPYFEDPEKARPYFKEMKTIYDNVKEKDFNNTELEFLSMGMTGDFEVAIEEGANIVRIGTGLFGPRE